jgi:hypothetical protein
MRDALDAPTTGALVFCYADAVKERPFGRGFGLIEDDIHALIERTLHVDAFSDVDGAARRVTTCR